MARETSLPSFLQKRKVLFGEKTDPEKMRAAGKQFMEAGRLDDALEFFQRCDADELVRTVMDTAIAQGNTPLVMRALKVLGQEATPQQWSACAENAEKARRHTCAALAYEKAGRSDDAARMRELVPGPGPQSADELIGAPLHEDAR
jgi:hypothetical protein